MTVAGSSRQSFVDSAISIRDMKPVGEPTSIHARHTSRAVLYRLNLFHPCTGLESRCCLEEYALPPCSAPAHHGLQKGEKALNPEFLQEGLLTKQRNNKPSQLRV